METKRRVRFNGTDFNEFPNLTVKDLRNLADLFDIDVSPRRLTLSGSEFVKVVGQHIVYEMMHHSQGHTEEQFVERLYKVAHNLTRPNGSDHSAAVNHFVKWLACLHDIDNIVPYMSMPASIVVKPQDVPRSIVSSVINKEYLETYFGDGSSSFDYQRQDPYEKAYVGISA